MKYLVIFMCAFVLNCGALKPVVTDDMKCDMACAALAEPMSVDACDAVCERAKDSALGVAVCRSACKEAIKLGQSQCKPVCLNAIK